MAKSKETLSPCIREVRFVRNEADEKGSAIIYYFQSEEYLQELNLVLTTSQLFANMLPEDLQKFKGNLKFKIPAEFVANPRYKSLIEAQPGKDYILYYCDSPQSLDGERGAVSWERVVFLELFSSWAKYIEYLKDKGKIAFASNSAVAGAARTPASTGAS